MQRLGLSISAVLFALAGFSYNEFGNLAEVRAKHPEFFKPGVVTTAPLNQEDWYVYCGDAEKCLSSETDDELYEEAQVQAKMNFFNHFAKKDPGVKVEVSGARRLYQWSDNEMRFVVMGVPVKRVVVTPGAPAATPVEHKATEVKTQEPRSASAEKQLESSLHQQTVSQEVNAPKTNPEAPNTNLDTESKNATAEVKAVNIPLKEQVVTQNAEAPQEEMTDDEKLVILRQRLDAHPGDFRLRMRMAKIFARQGRTRRAFNNYSDAARLLISDNNVADIDKAADLLEIAQYEEFVREYSLALKHYRIALRLGDKSVSKKANSRISDLLLRL